MNLFIMPPSPFERELLRLGGGFLTEKMEAPRPERSMRRLSASEREYIGSTDSSIGADDLAERFDIAVSYVYKLRSRYRYGS